MINHFDSLSEKLLDELMLICDLAQRTAIADLSRAEGVVRRIEDMGGCR